MVASAFCAVSPKAMRQRTFYMYFVYILKSINKNWYYTGHTHDLENRIVEHNTGRSRSTKVNRPYMLVYKEEYNTKSEAFKREQEIKRYKHGEAFKKLIEHCRVV